MEQHAEILAKKLGGKGMSKQGDRLQEGIGTPQ